MCTGVGHTCANVCLHGTGFNQMGKDGDETGMTIQERRMLVFVLTFWKR
jgi:hypothetical protein